MRHSLESNSRSDRGQTAQTYTCCCRLRAYASDEAHTLADAAACAASAGASEESKEFLSLLYAFLALLEESRSAFFPLSHRSRYSHEPLHIFNKLIIRQTDIFKLFELHELFSLIQSQTRRPFRCACPPCAHASTLPPLQRRLKRENLYFCTSKASKLSTLRACIHATTPAEAPAASVLVLLYQ